MSPGKQRRFNRLFASDGKTVIAALDHGIAGMAPLAGLQEPGRLISVIVRAGADALIVTPGIARGFAGMFGHAGLVLRVDCGPTALTGEWAGTKPIVTVEEALCLGVDAVIAMGIVGAPGETPSLHALTALAAACDRWGMVLVAEMLPGGFSASDASAEQIAVAARVGAEVGADVIKVRYSGSGESFRGVISACYLPVVMLGGSKQSLQQLRTSTCEAMSAGAKGVAVGRNIWQADDPGHVVKMLCEAVHG